MRYIIHLIISLLTLVFIACEDNNLEESNFDCTILVSTDAQGVVSVTTCDAAEDSLYFNLDSLANDTSKWHLSYKNISVQGFGMPSVSMHSSVYIAIDSINQFENITSSPDPSTFTVNASDLEYLGAFAVLNYNMETHVVSTSDLTYFAYLPQSGHKVFKIHFEEYSSGVLSFKLKQLVP